LIASALLAASVSSTGTAHASGATSFGRNGAAALALTSHALLVDGTFLVFDLVWGLRGRRLPVGLAFAQLLVPTTSSFLASGYLFEYSSSASVGFLVAGLYFGTHSILSLALPREGAVPSKRPQRAPAPRTVVSVTPIPHGAALLARGFF
jgi:hypothetical protein